MNATVKRDSPFTLSYQLRQILEDKISSGKYKPGDPFPTEREIAEQFGVSRITVREAKRISEKTQERKGGETIIFLHKHPSDKKDHGKSKEVSKKKLLKGDRR